MKFPAEMQVKFVKQQKKIRNNKTIKFEHRNNGDNSPLFFRGEHPAVRAKLGKS